jgi:mannose-6-phosphate isomerase-like protein (cupin superfamily)
MRLKSYFNQIYFLRKEGCMVKKLKKAIFNMHEIDEIISPLSKGIIFKPMLHPSRQDGSAINLLEEGSPDIHHSTALFKVKPGYEWPKTIFKIAEFYYITEGQGVIYIDGEEHEVKEGHVIYVAPGLERAIKNTGKSDLVYLSITDPEWTPEAEAQL